MHRINCAVWVCHPERHRGREEVMILQFHVSGFVVVSMHHMILQTLAVQFGCAADLVHCSEAFYWATSRQDFGKSDRQAPGFFQCDPPEWTWEEEADPRHRHSPAIELQLLQLAPESQAPCARPAFAALAMLTNLCRTETVTFLLLYLRSAAACLECSWLLLATLFKNLLPRPLLPYRNRPRQFRDQSLATPRKTSLIITYCSSLLQTLSPRATIWLAVSQAHVQSSKIWL